MQAAQFEYLLKKNQPVLSIFIFKPHKVLSQTKDATESEMNFRSFFGPVQNL
jgi:hypothetical protein